MNISFEVAMICFVMGMLFLFLIFCIIRLADD